MYDFQEMPINIFFQGMDDVERTWYKVRAKLKEAKDSFSNHELYPYLFNLVKLYQSVDTTLNQAGQIEEGVPREIKGISLREKKIIYKFPEELSDSQIREMLHLMKRAQPHIKEAVEEGRAVWEFVSKNLSFREIGIIPQCRREGYLLACNSDSKNLHIYAYSLITIKRDGETSYGLSLQEKDRLDYSKEKPSPEQVKKSIQEEYSDLPNPATYMLESELDFPFESTTLEVGKRIFPRKLVS